MEGHPHHHQPHHHYHHHQQQQQSTSSVSVDADRFPQWSIQETKEFLMIRAELNRSFIETKRNKQLWEVISTRMRDKGYNRSAEQCKCRWKNLFTRYKGCETIEEEAVRQQFPFYNEMQSMFSARMQSMQLSESEGGPTETMSKRKAVQLSSDEEEDIMEKKELEKSSVRKKKQGKPGGSTSRNNKNSIKGIVEDFMRQQMEMELQWREAFEAKENERRMKEMEWRQNMEALEKERLLMDRKWYEREEERRIREEVRAEKRDALITALLNKLRREDHM